MSHRISISINDKLWPHIANKPNKSRFIGELLKEHIHGKAEKPIVNAVKDSLLASEPFIAELVERMNKGMTNPRPAVHQAPVDSTPFVPRPPDPSTGYPCCTKDMPCKHWQWDETAGQRINTLTGAVRTSA